MDIEQILKGVESARCFLIYANDADKDKKERDGWAVIALEQLTRAVEALAAHVASQATDGK